MTEEELLLRRLLWLRHGCDLLALYGDDGEMQCALCQIDFKRDPAMMILTRFTLMGLEQLKQVPK